MLELGPLGNNRHSLTTQERKTSPKSGGRTVPTKRLFKENAPFIFFIFNGVVCSNTLFSNTSALTNSLLFKENSTCKILEHHVLSNTSGFQFRGPLARTNFLSALCGLPTKRKFWAGNPCGNPVKNFGQALQVLEEQALPHQHPARTSMTKLRSENFRADLSCPHNHIQKNLQATQLQLEF